MHCLSIVRTNPASPGHPPSHLRSFRLLTPNFLKSVALLLHGCLRATVCAGFCPLPNQARHCLAQSTNPSVTRGFYSTSMLSRTTSRPYGSPRSATNMRNLRSTSLYGRRVQENLRETRPSNDNILFSAMVMRRGIWPRFTRKCSQNAKKDSELGWR